MRTHRPVTMLLSALLVLGALPTWAEDLEVRVLDQRGNPIANAVVELPLLPVATPPEEVAIIDQINKHFVPMVIAVQRGQYVNFPNNDNIRHHVYSFSAIKTFSTDLYADIPGSPLQFDQAGIAVLGCNIHDSMVGYVYVSDWQQFAVTDGSGIVRFSATELPNEISVWHPWSQDPGNRRTIAIHAAGNGVLSVQLPIQEPLQVFGFRALTTE